MTAYPHRISYYDLDCHGWLKFSALLRMVHIAADENATDLGIGYAQMAPLGMSFVLQRFSARVCEADGIQRLPHYGEEGKIRTWPAAIERGLFIRKGAMHNKKGHKLLEWASLWLLFDLNHRKILKASALPIDTSTLLMGDCGVQIAPAKITHLADASNAPIHTFTHTVRYADTDTNAHMNNAVYGDLVGNAAFPLTQNAPATTPWTQLDINYLSEAKPNEAITITTQYVQTDSAKFIEGTLPTSGNSTPKRIFTAFVK
ncbi:MAG: thioesterase [Defluviitaleaceae bacterium]|nr:thioesterase [Defluviitaleaceae bacterium]